MRRSTTCGVRCSMPASGSKRWAPSPIPVQRPTPQVRPGSRPRCGPSCAARPRDLLAASRPDSQRRVDTGPFLALLERARVQLEGEVALGLSFEGSYSQTKPKEPAYGGHASGMGPAPRSLARRRCAVARGVRGGRTASDADLLRRADEGPHPGIGLRRRRAARLRRRRTTRHLSDDGRRAHAGTRAHPAPERPLPQPRRMEVRGRVEAGGRGRARPGATACAPGMSTTTGVSISTSRTGGRTSCSATAATAPSRKSPRARVSRPAAGAPAARFSTRMPTATWTCMSRATSRRPGTRSCARSGRSSGATGRASWSARPGFPARPICSSRTSGTAASWKRPRPTASPIRLAPTASASSRPTTTTTGSSISSSPTTRTPTSSIATWGTAASRASGSSPASR